ncbi:nuclear transport factor 2 family protein [Rhodonellum sp.]|uniref:nuclear transport factor 2 family protein n=1 Tax=Rhodonellum sp. TaxID=2231180 RepID=UPI002725E1F9|nr:nuclear transport factor 2 family protein [Rhodonellum sp.]MDO9552645.1 nuclear transport factor 2 family protein [Rhodonellum sp.]
MMTSNGVLLHEFYTAFAKADADRMSACYHSEVVFTDPAFGELKGRDVEMMWRMLIKRSKGNLKITFRNVHADEKNGTVDWIAEYVYGGTGRKVVNTIHASFEFMDGKIIRHNDQFDLWAWTRQALGWKGFLLGWTPFMKAKIQKQTNKLLKAFKEKN